LSSKVCIFKKSTHYFYNFFLFLFKLYTFCQSVAKLTLLNFDIRIATIMKHFLLSIFTFLLGSSALAEQPKNWQLGYQNSVTPVMNDLVFMHDYILLPIITAISVFVLFLILYAVWKFRASKNPNPSKTSHNTLIEVLWTVIPCLILVVIAIPSFKLLYKQDIIPKADITIKAIGYQWYWGYEYPDQKIAFEASMIETKDLKPGQPRLLATDRHVVVPVNKVVKVLITANDVLHAWALPAFGVKRDAVPGRINETWFRAEKEGIFYGQCSELCGIKHAFMPITVEVVSEQKYKEWVEMAKVKYAMYPEKKFLAKKEQ
jgi:cytochrome c oxidase subunit 2